MFTGIVKGLYKVAEVNHSSGLSKLSVKFTEDMLKGLNIGASVAINGVCLTVVKIENQHVWFDVISETLKRTNLKQMEPGHLVNAERSARFGDKVGGHLLSGHIIGTAEIMKVHSHDNNRVVTFQTISRLDEIFFTKRLHRC